MAFYPPPLAPDEYPGEEHVRWTVSVRFEGVMSRYRLSKDGWLEKWTRRIVTSGWDGLQEALAVAEEEEWSDPDWSIFGYYDGDELMIEGWRPLTSSEYFEWREIYENVRTRVEARW